MGWSCLSTAAYRPSESADLGECIIAGSPIHFHRRSESNFRKAAARTHHLGDVGMKGENRVACTATIKCSLQFSRMRREFPGIQHPYALNPNSGCFLSRCSMAFIFLRRCIIFRAILERSARRAGCRSTSRSRLPGFPRYPASKTLAALEVISKMSCKKRSIVPQGLKPGHSGPSDVGAEAPTP
jgi:hypothetical protein